MKEHISEIIITTLLVALIFIFINPYWMPMGLLATALCVFAGLFIAFVVFVWREKKGDERENHLRNIAGRVGYLGGALSLGIGIIVEILRHNMINVWLIIALLSMILAKIVGFIWAKRTY